MKLASDKCVSIIYHISVVLVPAQYLVLMGVIHMLLKRFSTGIGIVFPVLIFRVFGMTNRAPICCIHLIYSVPALLMVGIEYTIL